MKYSKKCECCGKISTAFTHRLNKPLVSALRRLVDRYEFARQPVNLQKDLHLTHNQSCNFGKLQYFGLVSSIGKSCGWIPTKLGIEFIYGIESSWDVVATMNGEILHECHECWKTTDVIPNLVMVHEIDESCYKKVAEYQEEKSQQSKIDFQFSNR